MGKYLPDDMLSAIGQSAPETRTASMTAEHDDLTAAYMVGFERGRDTGRAEERQKWVEAVMDLALLAHHDHYYCEDCWYTCPKHPEGCCNDHGGPDCNCGADEHNAKVSAVLARLGLEVGPRG